MAQAQEAEPKSKRARGELKLGYWAIRGLAQALRFQLAFTDTPFEDVLYKQGKGPDFDSSAWLDVKGTVLGDFPFPNLPYLIDGDVRLSQTNAIARYLARKFDPSLLGSTDEQRWKVDFLLEQIQDLRRPLVAMFYQGDFEKLKRAYEDNTVAAELERLVTWLGDSDWFAGDHITLPDFQLYEFLLIHAKLFSKALDKHAPLLAFMGRFEALPAIAKFMKSPGFISKPANNEVSYTTQHDLM